MKVLLRKDIKGVGRRGDIVEVKSGYARNFLVPSGSGLFASAEMEAQAASMRRSRDLKDAADKASAEVQKGVIESASITIASRAGTNGRLGDHGDLGVARSPCAGCKAEAPARERS